eukprot:GHVQ01027157.1.p1 GENE.GHVQ01027157.1~~GHVQ01027157.1.p1  ORF type:complete len:967 (-),score=98.55 GHVQ01027157.1:1247-4147(-)
MFEKTLSSLIQGLRANSGNEEEYIGECIQEIRQELGSSTASVKCTSLLKLWYLRMLGYDASWASFAVIEVMSNSKFTLKRPGYSCCAVMFDDNTDVALLTANLFRKDFGSREPLEAGLALSCLAGMCTKEISQDMYSDVVVLLTSSKPHLRKKAAVCCLRLFTKYPAALRSSFPRLRERLSDESPGVLMATVNTILELARQAPQQYMGLVPQMFHILLNNNNNWMTIKILKFLSLLCPFEERLPLKLQQPLAELLVSTKAKSTEYEIISLVLSHMSCGTEVFSAALERLKQFIDSSDRNLRYLGLELLASVISRPGIVEEIEKEGSYLQKKVLNFVDDADSSIRPLALGMLKQLATPTTFQAIADMLVEYHLQKPFKTEFLECLLDLAGRERYSLVEDFEWYLALLADVASSKPHSELISRHFVDITVRVPDARQCSVNLAFWLLGCFDDSRPTTLRGSGSVKQASGKEAAAPLVVGAAAWICGEYVSCWDPSSGLRVSGIVSALLYQASDNIRNSSNIQQVCLWSAMKVYLWAASVCGYNELAATRDMLLQTLPSFVQSPNVEVSERALFSEHLLNFFGVNLDHVVDWSKWNPKVLVPVHPKAQSEVEPPPLLHTSFFAAAANSLTHQPQDHDDTGSAKQLSKTSVGSEVKKRFRVLDEEAQPPSAARVVTHLTPQKTEPSATSTISDPASVSCIAREAVFEDSNLKLFCSIQGRETPSSPDAAPSLKIEVECDRKGNDVEDVRVSVDQGDNANFVLCRRSSEGKQWRCALYMNYLNLYPSRSLQCFRNVPVRGTICYRIQREEIIRPFHWQLPATTAMAPLMLSENEMNHFMQTRGSVLQFTASQKIQIPIAESPSTQQMGIYLRAASQQCNMHLLPQVPSPETLETPLKCLLTAATFSTDGTKEHKVEHEAPFTMVCYVACSSISSTELLVRIKTRSACVEASRCLGNCVADAVRTAVLRLHR